MLTTTALNGKTLKIILWPKELRILVDFITTSW